MARNRTTPTASEPAEGRVVKVRAIRTGFYDNQLRREDTPAADFEITLPEGGTLPSWVVER